MADTDPLVSIIIPHTAGTEILVSCLEALHRDGGLGHAEVILVDNASSDGSVPAAKKRFPELRVVGLLENQGYAGGCNRGIEVSRGRYVILLNDDTEVDIGCVRELVRVAEEDPSVAACQPKVRSLRDPTRFEYSGAAGGLMDLYGYPFSRGRLMGHVEVDEGQYDDPAEIFWASGVCLLVRKSVLDEVGAFDETFFAYMEEIDLCWRIHLTGRRIVYVPTSIVYHIGAYSLERQNVRRMYLNHRNSIIMLLKNYSLASLLWVLPIKIALELFIFAGALLRNPRRSQAVLLSFAWLLRHGSTLRRLRAETQALRRVPDEHVRRHLYRGMAPLWYFLFGIRHANDLPDIDVALHVPYQRGRSKRSSVLKPRSRNFLYAYLDQAPTSLALLRAAECHHLSRLTFERPILDAGCGDGTFTRILMNGVSVEAGVDENPAAIERARARGCYDELEASGLERMSFGSERFATVYCNSVLDHVADADAALREIHRVLRPGGHLYATVPHPRSLTFLFGTRTLRRLGLTRSATRYADLMRRVFRAKHLIETDAWVVQLERAGFVLERDEAYMPRRVARFWDLFLPAALLSRASQALVGRSVMFLRLHRLIVRLYRRWLPQTEEAPDGEGCATVLIARKA
jgi:GT2 family glycosyltransferase/SAM-dependent methyltransferase